jgi:hypothetical protein
MQDWSRCLLRARNGIPRNDSPGMFFSSRLANRAAGTAFESVQWSAPRWSRFSSSAVVPTLLRPVSDDARYFGAYPTTRSSLPVLGSMYMVYLSFPGKRRVFYS